MAAVSPYITEGALRIAAVNLRHKQANDPWDGPNGTARPNQRPPDGDWRTWLILAGRGYGKTRTAAEFIRREVQTGRMKRVALVGATASDVRDVMVQGESGLLECCRRAGFGVTYNPSLRRLKFVNGAVAFTYSADEPGRLRGPQHDGAWCLIAGTRILMADGSEKPIETIVDGDIVMTRSGARQVSGHASRVRSLVRVTFSDGRTLTGSAEHPIWTERGWIPLSQLSTDDIICSWRDDGDLTNRDTGIATKVEANSTVIESCGKRLTASRFRQAATFITSMASRVMTGLRTWQSSHLRSIERFTLIPQNEGFVNCVDANTSITSSAVPRSTVRAAARGPLSAVGRSQNEPVSIAARRSRHVKGHIAVSDVSILVVDGLVYNLSVDGDHEYFANGILTHNSDEIACLTADTMVATQDGSVPIADVQPGMQVMTRQGWRNVLDAWCSSPSADIYELTMTDGRTIRGTWNHPVWVEGYGWKHLRSLSPGDIMILWDHLQGHTELHGAASTGGSMAGITTTAGASYFTGLSTHLRTGRFLMDTISTIRIRTRSITTSRILSAFLQPITCAVTSRGDALDGQRISIARLRQNNGRRSHRGMSFARSAATYLRQQALGLGSALTTARQHIDAMMPFKLNLATASSAEAYSLHTNRGCGTAPLPAPMMQNGVSGPVGIAANHFGRKTREQSIARGHAPQIIGVVSVKRLLDKQAVYDIHVDGAHEFVANGILVHNTWRYAESWDQLQFGLRLGENPRQIATTTPRPILLVRELMANRATTITRGSTYDNRANLAPAFFDSIITKYEGTTLGRQELMGELIDDVEGALWKRSMIHHVKADGVPELRKIAVAVDPATTHGENSDETGIAVAGIGVDGNVYVLHGAGHRLSPNDWATEAVRLYTLHDANEIVAESNQGGEMVRQTIINATRHLSIRPRIQLIHASRGKQVRAEPIVALYEQERVFHVGSFPTLEDQQCVFPVGNDNDDQVDALVHAITAVAPTVKRGLGTA